jgi:hypothetical protein
VGCTCETQQSSHTARTVSNTRTRTHTHTHTHTHARTRTRTHAHARTRTRTRTHAHAHARTRTHAHAHARTHTHTHARTRTHTHTHTRMHARTHAHAWSIYMQHSTHISTQNMVPPGILKSLCMCGCCTLSAMKAARKRRVGGAITCSGRGQQGFVSL